MRIKKTTKKANNRGESGHEDEDESAVFREVSKQEKESSRNCTAASKGKINDATE